VLSSVVNGWGSVEPSLFVLAQAGVNTALAVPIAVVALPKKERVVMAQFTKKPAVAGFLDGQAGSAGAAKNAIG